MGFSFGWFYSSQPKTLAGVAPMDGSGEDRLSSLPDEVLGRILHRLHSVFEAARTSLLSLRWRRVWLAVPAFSFQGDTGRVRDCLAAYAARTDLPLRCIDVVTVRALADSTGEALRLAASCLSGELVFVNETPGEDEEGLSVERGVFELPCFENATKIRMRLGYLGLRMPSSGVFRRLTRVLLIHVHFHGPCEIGDAFSSPHCPSLTDLSILGSSGVDSFTLYSKSLDLIELVDLSGLQKLTIMAPKLICLKVSRCFKWNKPIANMNVPALELFEWMEPNDPSLVQLNDMPNLTFLSTLLRVFEQPNSLFNQHCARLLRRFDVNSLHLLLVYPSNLDNDQYMMHDITMLPHVEKLHLRLSSQPHAFGACVFHVLRMCTGVRKLIVDIQPWKVPSECPTGCICDQPNNWKTEYISLDLLEEVDVYGIEGVEHDVAFVRQLFRSATALKRMIILFDPSVRVRTSLCKKLISFSHPRTHVELRQECDGSMMIYEPADQLARRKPKRKRRTVIH